MTLMMESSMMSHHDMGVDASMRENPIVNGNNNNNNNGSHGDYFYSHGIDGGLPPLNGIHQHHSLHHPQQQQQQQPLLPPHHLLPLSETTLNGVTPSLTYMTPSPSDHHGAGHAHLSSASAPGGTEALRRSPSSSTSSTSSSHRHHHHPSPHSLSYSNTSSPQYHGHSLHPPPPPHHHHPLHPASAPHLTGSSLSGVHFPASAAHILASPSSRALDFNDTTALPQQQQQQQNHPLPPPHPSSLHQLSGSLHEPLPPHPHPVLHQSPMKPGHNHNNNNDSHNNHNKTHTLSLPPVQHALFGGHHGLASASSSLSSSSLSHILTPPLNAPNAGETDAVPTSSSSSAARSTAPRLSLCPQPSPEALERALASFDPPRTLPRVSLDGAGINAGGNGGVLGAGDRDLGLEQFERESTASSSSSASSSASTVAAVGGGGGGGSAGVGPSPTSEGELRRFLDETNFEYVEEFVDVKPFLSGGKGEAVMTSKANSGR